MSPSTSVFSEYREHRGRCAIAGLGATEFSSNSGRSELSLATEASLSAIDDAGVSLADIDGIVFADMESVRHNDLAHALGLSNLTFWGMSGSGGAAPCGMIATAVAAIESGQATTVLVHRSLNGRTGARYGRPEVADEVGGHGSYDEFFLPHGLVAPGQMWAIITQRHMYEYGTTAEQLGHIAIACRERANSNPHAQMRDSSLTMERYLDSRLISAPLRLFDYCVETDGACAVIVTSTERARDLAQPPALVRAVAQGGPRDMQPGVAYPVLLRESLTSMPSAQVARTLYQRAGMGPGDIDVAQLYDCFTPTVLLQLEDYGFCEKGEGGPFAASGAIGKGGSVPINTAGGNLSEGYIHGLNHIVEGVRQIRGESTSQVPGAETCLVTSGVPIVTSSLILTAS